MNKLSSFFKTTINRQHDSNSDIKDQENILQKKKYSYLNSFNDLKNSFSLSSSQLKDINIKQCKPTLLNKETKQLARAKSAIKQALVDQNPHINISFDGEYSSYLMYAIRHNLSKDELEKILNFDKDECLYYKCLYYKGRHIYENMMYLNKNLKQEPINYLLLAIELKVEIETIKVLLSNGIDPNTRSEALDTNPLCEAIKFKNIELVITLLNFNADPNIPGSIYNDYTPLAHAINKENKEFFDLLMLYGANANFKVSSNFYTPLVRAIEHDAFDLMEILLQFDANADGCVSNNSKTPLYYTSGKQDTTALKMLLKYGANPNLYYEDSPLLRAIECKNINAIKLLIENGAKVNAEYRYNCLSDATSTSLFYAIDQKAPIDIVKILLEYGAEANTEFKGKQAIEQAIENNAMDIAYLLRQYNAKANGDSIKKIVATYSHDPLKISLLRDAALVIKKHFKLEDHPNDQLTLPPTLIKEFKNNTI